MFRRIISPGGLLLLAGAVLFAMPASGWARGGSSGGGHFGGAHVGGYHGGSYRGGYSPNYGYRHYDRRYGGYGYNPYYFDAYPFYGYGYNPYPDGWSELAVTRDSGYNGAYQDAAPAYDATSVTPAATGFQSYYPAAIGTAQSDSIAHVTLNVPPDARVWFDSEPTTSTGSVRQFDSPPLTPGSRYTYDIKASWNQNGHEVTQSQQVEVTAGAHINVRFLAPSGTTRQASATRK